MVKNKTLSAILTVLTIIAIWTAFLLLNYVWLKLFV